MKKTKKMSSKKKILIAIGILLVVMLIVMAIISNLEDEAPKDLQECKTLKEVIEFYECELIKEKKSDDSNFKKDIYIKFKNDPITDEISQKEAYYFVIKGIAKFENYYNIRIIDESRELLVIVNCDNENRKIKNITINGKADYFERLVSNQSKNKGLEIKELDREIESDILKKIIENDFTYSKIDFGSKESTFRKYDVYFDEGYKVREIDRKVYNIVFTDKYEDSIIDGIKVGDSLEEIEKKLGDTYEEGNSLIYKCKDLNIIFKENQVSIYPETKNVDYEKFEKLLEEYNTEKDIKKFMDKLTTLWPDYYTYDYDYDYLYITYPVKGVKISYGKNNTENIQLYSNYGGNLIEEDEIDLYDVYFKKDKNLLIDQETRNDMLDMCGDPEEGTKFILIGDSTKDGLKDVYIKSIDKEYPDADLDSNILIYKYIWVDESNVIYSIRNKGMYLYNATSRNTYKIVEGIEEYNIIDYDKETHELKYDDKEVKINY